MHVLCHSQFFFHFSTKFCIMLKKLKTNIICFRNRCSSLFCAILLDCPKIPTKLSKHLKGQLGPPVPRQGRKSVCNDKSSLSQAVSRRLVGTPVSDEKVSGTKNDYFLKLCQEG